MSRLQVHLTWEELEIQVLMATMVWVSCSRQPCQFMDTPHFESHYICLLFMDRDVEPPCHTVDK